MKNNSNKKEPKIIDCTLRDGGYYNNWDFDIGLIRKYVHAVQRAGVDYIELGFRTINKSGYFGPLAYTTEDFIEELNINKSIKLGVMINASEFSSSKNLEKDILCLFPFSKETSKISFVRIACKFNEIEIAFKAGKLLKSYGFKICINLMQISSLKEKELNEFGLYGNLYKPDVLFIGDSTGSLIPDDIKKIFNAIRLNWKGEIGIHAHDNMRRALINTIEAYKNGFLWLDTTVQGMGRGPGNTKTEDLVFEIKDINSPNIDFLPLIDIVQKDFYDLKQKYRWGSNPFYFLSGKNQLHPTYVQNMLDDRSYRNEDIYASIKELTKNKSINFKKNKLQDSRIYYGENMDGEWSPINDFLNKEVLLLAPGKSINIHRNAIQKFIKKYSPLVVALNILDNIDDKLINYRIACHPIRIFSDLPKYKLFRQPLITPKKQLQKWSKKSLKFPILDFGIKVQENLFEFKRKSCIIPLPLVMAYSLAMLNSGKAKKIYCAGFDGYEYGDPRQTEVDSIWKAYFKCSNYVEIISLTNTVHKIPKSSIYSFL